MYTGPFFAMNGPMHVEDEPYDVLNSPTEYEKSKTAPAAALLNECQHFQDRHFQ